jgi:hypothetical protein
VVRLVVVIGLAEGVVMSGESAHRVRGVVTAAEARDGLRWASDRTLIDLLWMVHRRAEFSVLRVACMTLLTERHSAVVESAFDVWADDVNDYRHVVRVLVDAVQGSAVAL